MKKGQTQQIGPLSYSDFRTYPEAGKIAEIAIPGTQIRGTLHRSRGHDLRLAPSWPSGN